MNATNLPPLLPREVVRLLSERRMLWAVPALACGVLAAAYSLVMPRYWEASQALVVRQETAGSQGPTPGKFADLYEMRTLQETILELAKSQQVVVATIKAVDQKLVGAATEPTAEDIEKFRNRLKMLPPHGGEFGKTEVFYFYVKDRNRLRAMELVGELCRQLDRGLKQLRAARAEGLIAELEEQVALATNLHADETQRLKEFESQVGADLGELRMLHSGASGQSDLRQEAVQLEADLRKFETEVRQAEQLLALLRAAEQDPQKLIATPNSLLASQPALRRLKDGLVDAQLATAKLGGTRLAEHPRVKAAVEGEQQIRQDLHRELVTAISGAQVEIQLGQERVATTQARLANLEKRLSGLANRRAEYSNRVAAVDNSRITLDRARQNLSTANAAAAAAHSSSLVTRIDEPETGPYPAGLGRTVITGAGAVGGLMLGLGLVFLTTGIRTEVESPRVAVRTAAPVIPRPATVAAPPTPAAIELAAAQQESQEPPPTGVVLQPMSARTPTVEPVRAVAQRMETPRPQFEPSPTVEIVSTPVETSWASTWESEQTPWDLERQLIAASTATADTSTNRTNIHETPEAVEAAPTVKKPGLPIPPGTLPTAGGALPPLPGGQSLGSLSLQEALEAARRAQV